MNRAGEILADYLAGLPRRAEPRIVGLSGAQGSGKSTLAREASALLGERGLRCTALSLDDFYLTRAERAVLAAQVHPLLKVRGPPGTHDVRRACEALQALHEGRRIATLPRAVERKR